MAIYLDLVNEVVYGFMMLKSCRSAVGHWDPFVADISIEVVNALV
jgi:hypothetical protein